MRILVLAPAIDLLGGAEKHVREIYAEVARMGNTTVEIATVDFLGLPLEETVNGVLIRRIKAPGGHAEYIARTSGASSSPVAVSTLHPPGKLARLRFHAWYTARMARIARSSDADIIHAHTLLTPALAAVLSRKPIVTTLHGGEITRAEKGGPVTKAVYRALLRRSKGVIAVSRDLEVRTRALEPSAKLRYIPNGVTASWLSELKPRPTDGPLHIVCNRRLDAKNGHDVLLEAASILEQRGADYRLTIVGRGPLEDSLKAKAAALKLKNVHFTGFLSEEDMQNTIRSSHVAVLPSRMEGLPLAMLEAMAAGLAVVVTRVGGMPDLVDGNGFVIEQDDSKALAAKLELLSLDRQRCTTMGLRSREIVESGYTWRNVARQTHTFLKECLERST